MQYAHLKDQHTTPEMRQHGQRQVRHPCGVQARAPACSCPTTSGASVQVRCSGKASECSHGCPTSMEGHLPCLGWRPRAAGWV